MGFFERIFGKKDIVEEKTEDIETISIDFSETSAWFETEISGFLKTVNDDACVFISQIIDVSEKLNKDLDMLETAESDDEIGSRMRKFAYDNKTSFINKVRAFNSKITPPDVLDSLLFFDYFGMVAIEINKLTRETVRNIHLAKMLFADEIKEVTDCLNDISDIILESQKALNRHKDKSDKVKEIRDMLHGAEDILAGLGSDNKRLMQKKISLEKLQDKKKRYELSLHKLETSEDVSELKQIIEQKDDADAKISKIRSDILQTFSYVSKVLKKYERHSTGLNSGDEKILALYIESPVKALVRDKGFKTLSRIIENTEILIDSGKIDLKDKQKNKVLVRLNNLKDISMLDGWATEYNQLQDTSENLKDVLCGMEINNEIERARQNLNGIDGLIVRDEQDILRIEKEVSDSNKIVSLKTEELETVLSEMLGRDVSVNVF